MNGVETPQDKSDKVEEAESEKRKNGKQKMNNPDEGATGTFWEHLDALRDRLLKALAVTVVCALVAFFLQGKSLFGSCWHRKRPVSLPIG